MVRAFYALYKTHLLNCIMTPIRVFDAVYFPRHHSFLWVIKKSLFTMGDYVTLHLYPMYNIYHLSTYLCLLGTYTINWKYIQAPGT